MEMRENNAHGCSLAAAERSTTELDAEAPMDSNHRLFS